MGIEDNSSIIDLTRKIPNIILPNGLTLRADWFSDKKFIHKLSTIIRRQEIKSHFKNKGILYKNYAKQHGLCYQTFHRYISGELDGSRKNTPELIAVMKQLEKDGIIEVAR